MKDLPRGALLLTESWALEVRSAEGAVEVISWRNVPVRGGGRDWQPLSGAVVERLETARRFGRRFFAAAERAAAWKRAARIIQRKPG